MKQNFAKIKFSGNNQNYMVRRELNSAYKPENTILTVMHDEGSIMGWGGSSSDDTRDLYIIKGTTNSQTYCEILENHLCNFASRVSMGTHWVFQEDNDSKHTSRQTSEWLNRGGATVLEWSSQSLYLNPIESLLKEFRLKSERDSLRILEIWSEYLSKNREQFPLYEGHLEAALTNKGHIMYY